MHIRILGAGVTGLTTAQVLSETKHTVEVISAQRWPQTTSAKAGAVWFPFEVHPQAQANSLAQVSWMKLFMLSREQVPGLRMVSLLVTVPPGSPEPAWAGALVEGRMRRALPQEIPVPDAEGWILDVPLMEVGPYLDWLEAKCLEKGVRFRTEHVQRLEDLLTGCDVLINCTGLGALPLTGDDRLYPIRGQALRVELPEGAALPCFTDKRASTALAYCFPHRDYALLGGTAEPHVWSEQQSVDIAGIQQRVSAWDPRLGSLRVLDAWCGLRPGRDTIRLERDPVLPVIHNYGHGGAGFTVSWGCAYKILYMLRED